jgi:hypothetical protein
MTVHVHFENICLKEKELIKLNTKRKQKLIRIEKKSRQKIILAKNKKKKKRRGPRSLRTRTHLLTFSKGYFFFFFLSKYWGKGKRDQCGSCPLVILTAEKKRKRSENAS